MILPPTSEISHHHKVTNIRMSPTSLTPRMDQIERQLLHIKTKVDQNFYPLFTYIEVEQSVPIGWAELQLIPELILLPYKQFSIVFRSKKYNIPRAQNFPLSKVQFQNNQVFQKCEEYETNDIPKYEKGLKRINITGLIRKIRRIYIFLQLVLFKLFHVSLSQSKMT